MATNATEQPSEEPIAPVQTIEPRPESVAPPSLASAPAPSSEVPPATIETLRAEFAEIAAVAAQASRLGVTVDAADAMRRGISADALRRSVLDTLAARTEATSVISVAPSTPAAGDSPIVRRARERAAAARS